MSGSSGQPVGVHSVASQLLENSGVLAAAQIIADLNVEKSKDQSTFENVIAAIERDQPLAKRVIFLANSAWFGGNVKVNRVHEAFGRLGTTDFYKASVAAALRCHLGDGDEQSRWWQESETTAHIAEMTAQQLNPDLVEAAFFAALFRDCAVPLMVKHLPDYSYLAADALGFSPESVEIEVECNQTDHCTVGAAIVRALNFPAAHAEAVAHHHGRTLSSLEPPEARQLLAMLLLAKRIETWSDKGIAEFHNDPAEDSLMSEIAIAFRLTKGALDDVVLEMIRLYGLRRAHD